uniref:C2 calcium dependent domain containing 4C n=1 Tax=Malurus cyaneus samueli TaxID=2593467 RepID=A0A8C5UKW8_9PASS
SRLSRPIASLGAAGSPNVLTPDKIPDFFIPPKLSAAPAEAEGSEVPAAAALGASVSEQDLIETAEDWTEDSCGTNADPQAQTAMSLPYVPKAQTSYGFATLMESPHTRRKESLFHSDSTARAAAGHPPTSARLSCTPGATSAAERATRAPPPSLALRLPAALPLRVPAEALQPGDSADTSPSAQRRARSAPAGTQPATAVLPLDLPAGRDREHSLRLSRGGSLRLAAEYDPSNARLRVRLVSAEDLYDTLVDLRSINCCVSLCLNPGKLQKQRSTIVKNSRNPVFNEDFFFDGLGPGHARKMSLKLKVVNKGSSLKRDTLLGEKELPLTALLSCL